MIKGVNRHVIEVTETESEYYERALLVIKPEYASMERDLLEREARKVLKELGAPSSMKRRNRLIYWGIRLGGSAMAGAAVTLLILLL